MPLNHVKDEATTGHANAEQPRTFGAEDSLGC